MLNWIWLPLHRGSCHSHHFPATLDRSLQFSAGTPSSHQNLNIVVFQENINCDYILTCSPVSSPMGLWGSPSAARIHFFQSSYSVPMADFWRRKCWPLIRWLKIDKHSLKLLLSNTHICLLRGCHLHALANCLICGNCQPYLAGAWGHDGAYSAGTQRLYSVP